MARSVSPKGAQTRSVPANDNQPVVRGRRREHRRPPRIGNRRPVTKSYPGRKPKKRPPRQPLREIVAHRARKTVRRARPAVAVQIWQSPQRRALRHYARLVEATPTPQDTTAVVNQQARAEARRITSATHAAQQAQQRAQWRQEADAIARHWRQHEGRIEDVRRVKEGLRAERQATDAGAPSRKLALYRQLAAIMGNDHR